MKFKVVDKKIQLGLGNIIRFQLVVHCHLNNIPVSDVDINCLTILGMSGNMNLSEFCTLIASKKLFKTTQTARNCLVKLEKMGLIIKDGASKKRFICLNPALNIQTQGNILLQYKVFYIDS